MPTFGLLVASLRTAADNNATGWWTALTQPAELTLENYREPARQRRRSSGRSGTRCSSPSRPRSLVVIDRRALAAYAFAWMPFPRPRRLFLVVVGLLVVPLQIALIPVAQLYGVLGIFGTIPGVVLFHVAFGLPFAIFLLRNFFVGIPRDLLEAARMDGASEMADLPPRRAAAGLPAIASLADLPVPLGLERPAGRAGLRRDRVTAAHRHHPGAARSFGSNIDVLAPGAFLQMVVPLIVFFAFQRHFVQGLLAGSMK